MISGKPTASHTSSRNASRACLALFSVGFVIQFYRAKHRQGVGVAQHKIEMLATDLVECALPLRFPQTLAWIQHIRDADFRKHPEFVLGHLIENPQKERSAGGEKRVQTLIA